MTGQNPAASKVTYPCLMGHQIVELTAEQRDKLAWKALPVEAKIAHLLERVEALEADNFRMKYGLRVLKSNSSLSIHQLEIINDALGDNQSAATAQAPTTETPRG